MFQSQRSVDSDSANGSQLFPRRRRRYTLRVRAYDQSNNFSDTTITVTAR